MADFLKLIKGPSKAKLDVRAIFALVVFLVALAVAMIWTVKPDLRLAEHLPASTVFYYHQSKDNQTQSWLLEHKLIKQEAFIKQLETISKLLGEESRALEEFVWFKTADNTDNNHYLVQFSKSVKLLEPILEAQTNYHYAKLDNYTLLVTESLDLDKLKVNNPSDRLTGAEFSQGVDIYWQSDAQWPWLEPLSVWLKPIVDERDIFFSIYQKKNKYILKLSQPISNKDNLNDLSSFNTVRVPDKFDSAIAFNSQLLAEAQNFIDTSLIKPLFNQLPYYGLEDIYLQQSSLLVQKDDSWLLVSDTDLEPLAISLASQLDLVEEQQLLPDGTAYTELVAKDEPLITNHDSLNHTYWQLDSLFGWQYKGGYYLTNSQDLIENLIAKDSIIADNWQDCGESSIPQISDLLVFRTNNVPDSTLKDYLDSQNIDFLAIYSYFDDFSQGWYLCFE